MTCSPWDLPMLNGSSHSNLQCFLHCITPTLHTKKKRFHISNGFMQAFGKDTVEEETLTLSEFWHSYTEWSACGAGVPIMLDNGKRVVQYYSPFLSALQLFTTKPYPWSKSESDQMNEELENKAKHESLSCNKDNDASSKSQFNEELDSRKVQHSCSKDDIDTSSETTRSDQIDLVRELENKAKPENNSCHNDHASTKSQSGEEMVELENIAKSENDTCSSDAVEVKVKVSSSNGWCSSSDATQNTSSQHTSCSSSDATLDNSTSSQHASCSSFDATLDNSTSSQYVSSQIIEQCGYLYCQFNEVLSPYQRIPLLEKIKELAKTHPGLLDLRSIDVSPYSWVAIAWYPLYQIPTVKNVKELSACFLTYHPLSFLSQGSIKDKKGEITLPPFALVPYKMSGKLWMNPETSDEDSIICQRIAASCWLDQLHFQHHDFNFFMSHR